MSRTRFLLLNHKRNFMKKTSLSLIAAASLLATGSAFAQVSANVPGVSATINDKGIAVKVPGVSATISGDSFNEPAAKPGAKNSTAASTKTVSKPGIGGKCVNGVLRVTVGGSGDATHSNLICDRVELLLTSSGDLKVGNIAAKSVLFTVGGSGDLTVGKLDTDALEVNSSSSGHVTVSQGRAANTKILLGGSGDYNAQNVIAESVAANLTSSGHATVHATRAIEGMLAGSGDLRHTGSASSVSVNAISSGSVTKL
jgi:hypothetical protein